MSSSLNRRSTSMPLKHKSRSFLPWRKTRSSLVKQDEEEESIAAILHSPSTLDESDEAFFERYSVTVSEVAVVAPESSPPRTMSTSRTHHSTNHHTTLGAPAAPSPTKPFVLSMKAIEEEILIDTSKKNGGSPMRITDLPVIAKNLFSVEEAELVPTDDGGSSSDENEQPAVGADQDEEVPTDEDTNVNKKKKKMKVEIMKEASVEEKPAGGNETSFAVDAALAKMKDTLKGFFAMFAEEDQEHRVPSRIAIPNIVRNDFLTKEFQNPCTWNCERDRLCFARGNKSLNDTLITLDDANFDDDDLSFEESPVKQVNLPPMYSEAPSPLDRRIITPISLVGENSITSLDYSKETSSDIRGVRFAEQRKEIEYVVEEDSDDDEESLTRTSGCSDRYFEFQRSRRKRQEERSLEEYSVSQEAQDFVADCTYLFQCLSEMYEGSECKERCSSKNWRQ